MSFLDRFRRRAKSTKDNQNEETTIGSAAPAASSPSSVLSPEEGEQLPEREESPTTAIQVNGATPSAETNESQKRSEVCVHCGAQGYFGRYDNDGPVCDECADRISLEVIFDVLKSRVPSPSADLPDHGNEGSHVLSEKVKLTPVVGPGGKQAWALLCPLCGNYYVIGINAQAATLSDVLSMFQGSVVMGGVPASYPTLVGPTDATYQAPPPTLTEQQWQWHGYSSRAVRTAISRRETAGWYCNTCQNRDAPTPFPPVPVGLFGE